MKTVAAFLLVRSPESIHQGRVIAISSRARRCRRGDSSSEELGSRGPEWGGAPIARRRLLLLLLFDRPSVPLSLSLCSPFSLLNSHQNTPIPQAQLGGNASPKAADIEKILSSGE